VFDDENVLTLRVIQWDGEWGIFVDYGAGSWRRYVVGTRLQAEEELRRLNVDKRARRPDERLRVYFTTERHSAPGAS
jgi:hypothetical protein